VIRRDPDVLASKRPSEPAGGPNQVWAADITYVPMARGFVYVVAIVDWFTRKVLAWRKRVVVALCGEA
jgi:putative transposase